MSDFQEKKYKLERDIAKMLADFIDKNSISPSSISLDVNLIDVTDWGACGDAKEYKLGRVSVFFEI